MKSLILAAAIAAFSVTSIASEAPKPLPEPVVKTVCHDRKDKSGKVVMGKDGKPVQNCKQIKIRKKLDGTPIPEKK
jgi:hypothetical protein